MTTDVKEFSLYRSRWSEQDALILAQTITEAIHEGFDGWSDEEKSVIERFIQDLSVGCAYVRRDVDEGRYQIQN